ncbi:HmuY family protein [Reinekea blandensis]|uniref:HmuY protein n=1 Tax=Reinekea blandensis MED297 TaxID=314283 RepID=A4BG05_9GAMM|nr:HmuY family protein [Reinekea blandensis]EAR09023.1 hypothetical protein MED297_04002 [Reinekea sp. MED297] [Reinekea blandensis MED297]
MKVTPTLKLATLLVATLPISACLDTSADNTDDPNVNEVIDENTTRITIDASSHTQWNYLDLAQGTLVDESDTWHLALQRYNVILHPDAEAAIVAEQADFYTGENANTSIFINSTASSELDHLIDATLPAEDDFAAANDEFAISNGLMDVDAFLFYDMTTHGVYANDDNLYVVQSNTGNAYAKLTATQIIDPEKTYADADAYDEAVFQLEIAANGSAAFGEPVTWSISTPQGVGEGCFDIETQTSIDCTDAAWDIKYSNTGTGRGQLNPTLRLNSGTSGAGAAGVAGPFDNADSAQIVNPIQDVANDDFDLTPHHYKYNVDGQSSVFSEFPWQAYGVNGGHNIWPNYRVYAVRDADETYYVQFINYYNEAAVSGHVTLRYLQAP